jgi:hypothetical protein
MSHFLLEFFHMNRFTPKSQVFLRKSGPDRCQQSSVERNVRAIEEG